METRQTIEELRKLKLYGMADYFESATELPLQERPSFELLVAQMTDAEILSKNRRKTEKYIKGSRLRYDVYLENVECGIERNFTNDMKFKLSDCSFITSASNILITGKTGCGKSYLACAIGKQACKLGYKTLFINMSDFIFKIEESHRNNTLQKLLCKMEKNNLIILDDWGTNPMTLNSRLALLQILEDFWGRKSMVITSQLPVSKWYDYIGNNATLCDALMDRITANSWRIELKGESRRVKKNK